MEAVSKAGEGGCLPSSLSPTGTGGPLSPHTRNVPGLPAFASRGGAHRGTHLAPLPEAPITELMKAAFLPVEDF